MRAGSPSTPIGHETEARTVRLAKERLFPVMGLGQKSEFTATPGTRWFGSLLTAAGWLLATAVAAAASRSLNKA